MDLAEHLKTLRKQAKMTQAQVAKAIEISQQGYAYWEQGKKRPSYDNLVKIAKLFNISVDTLISNKTNDDIDLSEVELLFRSTSDGMSNEEKEVFKQELLHFMKERKKLLMGKSNDSKIQNKTYHLRNDFSYYIFNNDIGSVRC